MIKLFRLPELHVPISFIFVGFYRNLNERDIFKWRYFVYFTIRFRLVFFLHSCCRKYFSVSPNQWSVWNVKFTCNTARLSLSCDFFARGRYWRRRINILGEAGKVRYLRGKWKKNTVMKRGAEKFLLLQYYHIVWFYFSLQFLADKRSCGLWS